MFNPVKIEGAAPQLTASVPNVYGKTLNGPSNGPSYRSGPVFGLNSLAEPNVSPDTITVQGYMVWPDDGTDPKIREIRDKESYMFPNGTPVYVVPSKKKPTNSQLPHNVRTDRHNEPIHKVYTMANKKIAVADADGKGFLTVLVGAATFKRGDKLTHFAVAVQNVASVHVAHMQDPSGNPIMQLRRKTWPLGKKLYLCVGDASDPVFCLSEAHNSLANRKVCRSMRLTATEVGGELKCDLGALSIT